VVRRMDREGLVLEAAALVALRAGRGLGRLSEAIYSKRN